MSPTPTDDPESGEPPRDPLFVMPRGWLVLVLAITPALLIVSLMPGFVTQDGPAHLYNAAILKDSLSADSPFSGAFAVRWAPLPNWAGAAVLMGLLSVMNPRWADVTATMLPLIGLAASAFFLRRKVAGDSGDVASALYCGLISINVAWLFGFTSFLLGACLFPITLGVWWDGRHGLRWGRVLLLAGLVVVGYFGHLVSLGLTIFGLIVLAVFTPGPDGWRRFGKTLLAISPMVVLGPIYRGLMKQGGPIAPVWGHLPDVGSLVAWRQQLGWVDPITLGRKLIFPGVATSSRWFGLVSPVVLMIVALVVFFAITWRTRDRERRGWLVLAGLLILGGIVTPDTLGETHGNYLPQRVVLLGLVAIVPWLRMEGRLTTTIGTGLLGLAMAIQTLTVWTYAQESRESVVPFLKAADRVGFRQRVGTLLIDIRGQFRANPRLHADNLVGVESSSIVWANYETIHYYFPVQVRDDVPHPPAGEFEAIALMDHSGDAEARAMRWLKLLSEHHREIDVLFVWGTDPMLEAITSRWFDALPVYQDGFLRVLRHR